MSTKLSRRGSVWPVCSEGRHVVLEGYEVDLPFSLGLAVI